MKKTIVILSALFLLAGCNTNNNLSVDTLYGVLPSESSDRSDSLIVIDAGHGGHDTGAVAEGKHEKDLVLQITKKLYYELRDEGYSVHMTRDNDTFIKLSGRTRIADRKNAKVFISIHANAIGDKSRFQVVEGVETYFLQKTRDAKSQSIAARENAAVLQGADALSKNVIIDSVLNGPKIIESNKLAIDVQRNMMKKLSNMYDAVKDGGVRPAPFYVLVGASRPSILVEVGYMTNNKERARLFDSNYQDLIVEGIAQGVNNYVDNRKRELGF
jgi:N-acetylmuramoyl-L-alanine amidase